MYHLANYNVDLRKGLRIGKNLFLDLCRFSRKIVCIFFFVVFRRVATCARPSHRRFLSTEGCMVDQAFFYTHNANNKTMRSVQAVFSVFFYARIARSQNDRPSCDGE